METTLNSLDVLTGLEAIGFSLSTDGKNLTLDGPTEMLDDRRCDLIRHFKSEIVTHLLCCDAEREVIDWADSDDNVGDEPIADATAYSAAATIRCPHCGSLDVSDGRQWRWCIGCETRLGVSKFAGDDQSVFFAFGKIERASDGRQPKAGSNQQTLNWKD
ncbi:hypothetical protein ACFL2H_07595 [Planctomycetota bacterium]